MSFNSKDTKGYWAVNGTALYKPQGCEITHENYVGSNSGRTEDGVMHIDWLRRDLRKVTIKYNAMTGNEMDELVGLVQGKNIPQHSETGERHARCLLIQVIANMNCTTKPCVQARADYTPMFPLTW